MKLKREEPMTDQDKIEQDMRDQWLRGYCDGLLFARKVLSGLRNDPEVFDISTVFETMIDCIKSSRK